MVATIPSDAPNDGAVFEASSSVRRCAMPSHLTDGESAHDRSAVCRAAANDLSVCGSPAEFFDLMAHGEDAIEVAAEDLGGLLGFTSPGDSENLRGENDGGSSGVGVGLGGITVLGASENGKLVLRELPAGAGGVIADQAKWLAFGTAEKLDQLGAFTGGCEQNGECGLSPDG
jgi:hypothetical protein